MNSLYLIKILKDFVNKNSKFKFERISKEKFDKSNKKNINIFQLKKSKNKI